MRFDPHTRSNSSFRSSKLQEFKSTETFLLEVCFLKLQHDPLWFHKPLPVLAGTSLCWFRWKPAHLFRGSVSVTHLAVAPSAGPAAVQEGAVLSSAAAGHPGSPR